MRRLGISTALVAALFLLPQTAGATPIADIAGSSTFTPGGAVLGWEFSVSAPITIDGLGVWDHDANGLTDSHQVGLWDSSQNLLASATVGGSSTPDASANAAGQWMFTSVAPTSLGAGNYILGAIYANGNLDLILTSFTGGPQLTISPVAGVSFVQSRAEGGIALTFPTITAHPGFLTTSFFGPTARVAAANPVPEPGTLCLLGAGLVVAARLRTRRT